MSVPELRKKPPMDSFDTPLLDSRTIFPFILSHLTQYSHNSRPTTPEVHVFRPGPTAATTTATATWTLQQSSGGRLGQGYYPRKHSVACRLQAAPAKDIVAANCLALDCQTC
jgi:hypothetical protein